MGMNIADHCYDTVLDYLLNQSEMKYDERASEALSQLHRLADPQADEVKAKDAEIDALKAEVRRAKIEVLEELAGNCRRCEGTGSNNHKLAYGHGSPSLCLFCQPVRDMLAKLKQEGE